MRPDAMAQYPDIFEIVFVCMLTSPMLWLDEVMLRQCRLGMAGFPTSPRPKHRCAGPAMTAGRLQPHNTFANESRAPRSLQYRSGGEPLGRHLSPARSTDPRRSPCSHLQALRDSTPPAQRSVHIPALNIEDAALGLRCQPARALDQSEHHGRNDHVAENLTPRAR